MLAGWGRGGTGSLHFTTSTHRVLAGAVVAVRSRPRAGPDRRTWQAGVQPWPAGRQDRHTRSESSATEELMWDYEDDDMAITLTRDSLRPNQAITLRWDVSNELA